MMFEWVSLVGQLIAPYNSNHISNEAAATRTRPDALFEDHFIYQP